MRAFVEDDAKNASASRLARSFSGHERNRLFIQSDGNFNDATLVSGADFRSDARGFALLDFNHDGWQDMVVSSPNSPRFRIFENRIRNLAEKNDSNFCQIRLEGGNHLPGPSQQWSSRDAVGAVLTVTINGVSRALQRSIGEGLSSQNSAWIHVGMGQARKIDRVEVAWPSGQRTVLHDLEAGQRLTVFERKSAEAR